jgi:hypothetical protein
MGGVMESVNLFTVSPVRDLENVVVHHTMVGASSVERPRY